MADKDFKPMVRVLFPLARKVFLTAIPFRRAARPRDIRAVSSPFRRKISIREDFRRAVAEARTLAGPAGGSVLVAGSLFLVGEVKQHCPAQQCR